MSHAFHNAGFRLASAFSPPPEQRAAVAHRNPTHVYWDALMEEFGVLKLELLRTNPFHMDLAKLQSVLQARPHWRALVDDALAAP